MSEFDLGAQQQTEEGMLRVATMQAAYYKGLVAGGMEPEMAVTASQNMVTAMIELYANNPKIFEKLQQK